ncbi:MAG: hypothetical protein MUC56_15640, partial [Thermoanaerobaculales bacterium]|nr:hypothetical protein [Thermoanaerobaculales bacterium]
MITAWLQTGRLTAASIAAPQPSTADSGRVAPRPRQVSQPRAPRPPIASAAQTADSRLVATAGSARGSRVAI